MSRNNRSTSSTSTPSARKRTLKTREMQQAPDSSTTASLQVVAQHAHSDSQMADPYGAPEFRLAWDNQVKFHVSRQLLHLRRYRDKSQGWLAKEIKSSQSAIARIEGGDENITLDTVERIVVALNGRLQIAIPPAELSSSRRSSWWELLEGPQWTLEAIGRRNNFDYEEALLLLRRPLPKAEVGQAVVSEGLGA